MKIWRGCLQYEDAITQLLMLAAQAAPAAPHCQEDEEQKFPDFLDISESD